MAAIVHRDGDSPSGSTFSLGFPGEDEELEGRLSDAPGFTGGPSVAKDVATSKSSAAFIRWIIAKMIVLTRVQIFVFLEWDLMQS